MTGKRTKERRLKSRLARLKRVQWVLVLTFIAILGLAMLVPVVFVQRTAVVQSWWTLALMALAVLALQMVSYARTRTLLQRLRDLQQPWQRTRDADIDFDKVWKDEADRPPGQPRKKGLVDQASGGEAR